MGEIAREAGAYLLADIAHIAPRRVACIPADPARGFCDHHDAQDVARRARVDFVPREEREGN